MPDFYKVNVKQQAVFHDGTSMIVLQPKTEKNPSPNNPEVAEQFIARLVADGAIAKPSGWEAPEVVDDGGVPVATADGGATVNVPEKAAETQTEAEATKAEAKSAAAADKAP